ncbi:MAG: Gldg family protein [Gammaproteobacteria bacterium]|nr:Gldg family protein [Gammaproteobacteria bacterium]
MSSEKTMSKTISYSGLVILAILFVLVNMVSGNLFKSLRMDLTEDKLYTLSSGTLNILKSIQEPITLHYFFSDQASQEIPQLRTYANRVRELLQEYAQLSNGKITLHVIDPVAYSEEEDQAAEFGLQGVPTGPGGNTIYFGLAGSNSVGESRLIPFFQPNKEQFLEYDVTKLIYTLLNSKKPVVGLISKVPMFSSFDIETQKIRDPWVITSQLQQLFEVKNIDFTASSFDKDMELLMLVHPKDLSKKTLYAIDQYVLNGGNLIVYVDPYAEADVPAVNPESPIESAGVRSSSLKLLFDAWGIDYSPASVVGDRKYALAVDVGNGQQERHYSILGLDKQAFQDDDVITSSLDFVTVAMAGSVKPKEGADVTFEPLIHSSSEAALFESSKFRFLPKLSSLSEDFTPSKEEYVIAGRFQMQPNSAFPNGAPEDAEVKTEHVKKAANSVNVIVVTDVDMLTDRMWVNVQDFLGQKITDAWASNGDFAVNAVDNLLGSSDLISVRGRATATKPFTRVEELRREADDQFRVQEQSLQNKLRGAEQKIAQLQSQRDDQSSMILSPEQSAEIQRFQAEKLQVRKELRKVRHELDKNIHSLGAWLKAINIGLMPVILTILALVLSALRIKKRVQQRA